MQQPSTPQELPAEFDPHVVLFPTRYADYVPKGLPAQLGDHPAYGVLPTPDGGKVVWAVR